MMRNLFLRSFCLLAFGCAFNAFSATKTSPYDSTMRPAEAERLFHSEAVENEIVRVKELLSDPKLRWMFENCFPNTLDTTVHFKIAEEGNPDTFVVTGDIPAMWLRDSSAQVWPYLALTKNDEALREMIKGVIRRQLK